MATVPNPVPAAFTSAVLEFKNKLKDDELYDDILKTDSIDKVYAMTDSLQEEQARRGRLQRLAKIQPYIERLRGYEGVLDTFVQVKPDILALIWGPIKLLIQWASVLPKSLDALVETIAEIGQLLPEFKDMTIMFNQNKQLLGLLVLFFQDILDFYFVALKFFGMSRWRFFFESVWPKQRDKIKIVMSHIERHTILMRDEVRLEHIREEHDSKQQALEHFDRTQRHNQHQEYNIIKTNISPKSYDNILDRIRGRTCKGTGTWLLEDETFKVWLDITDSSPSMLWLQGIPGAGKTFLCGTAITKAMTSCRTVFAFLSHIHSSSTSALSVLHSLIFQIASENESLQEVLCQSGRDGLKNNLDVAAALLQTILLCAGPACIAIDGLDEIEERERERLLYQLIDISKACPESRILISSRPEDDISKILGAVSSTIRVDNHNAGGIQTYVNSRTREWLKHNDIFPEYRDEIRRLLAPVATKAKGMFLYAQIMLSSISLLSDIEEIRNELRVLPESLDQAYGRIFRRINSFQSPAAKKKCRSLLGWISCSPTPMTIQELEQALVVSSNPDDGFRVSSSLNVVRLCGPIVEVVDNYVQFVHFTVQEYINSPHTDGFIDITEATLSLATCCIRYLCQNHHDVEVDEENFENNILSGCYRLHYFASDTWLELVAEYLSRNGSEPPSPDLTSALESLNQKRSGWILGSPAHLDELWELWYHPHLNRMEQHREDLFSLLRNTAYFRQKCDTSQFHIIDLKSWTEYDPLTISEVSSNLYKNIDQLKCNTIQHRNECCCNTLERHYGQSLYKCGLMGCPFRRLGFTSDLIRNSHSKQHDRPWKCDVPSCQFAENGFLSRRMRDDHLDFHRHEGRSNIQPAMTEIDEDEIQPVLFDLVQADDVESVKTLLQRNYKLQDRIQEELLNLAAFSGSATMLDLLWEKYVRHNEGGLMWRVAISSIEGENEETLTFILSKMLKDWVTPNRRYYNGIRMCANMLSKSVSTGSMNVLNLVEDFMVASSKKSVMASAHFKLASMAMNVIRATGQCPEKEDWVSNLWLKLGARHEAAKTQHRNFGAVLHAVARTTLSIRFAQKILGYGVSVDNRKSSIYPTPLQSAAKRSSAESAKFIEFLLHQGANPDTRSGRYGKFKSVREEIGAQEIAKWLNVSWDDLIQKVKNEREKADSHTV